MHRLRRALERVSFDQTLGGRLDESDGETKPPSRGTLSYKSITDSSKLAKKGCVFDYPLISSSRHPSDGLMLPASPLDWDTFTDPEYLFSAALPDPQPGQCRALIHGLLNGRAVSWEVSVDLGHLWTPEHQETPVAEKHSVGTGEEGNLGEGWGEMIHQLTARSVIRDFEKMAEKEGDTRHGEDEGLFIHLLDCLSL